MKRGLKRALAWLAALTLAVSAFALAEEASVDVVFLDDDAVEGPLPEAEVELGDSIIEIYTPEPSGAELSAWQARFVVEPADAAVSIQPEPLDVEANGAYLLSPGDYTYSVSAEGYVPVEDAPFTIEAGDVLIECTLKPIEAVDFEQSRMVDDVIVTVKAAPGVFPEDAELFVKRVPGDGAYTFDIRVVDPATGEEYQPADGQTVRVAFSMAEVADDSLTPVVYHIADGGLAQRLEVVETDGVTVVVESEGFSLYTLKFLS